MLTNEKLFVISGGPGSGKTTTLHELAQRGFPCVPEVARQIIQEQVLAGGDALPWGDREKYTQLMLERSIESYRQHYSSSCATFFDRGIPDTLGYARLIGLRDTAPIELACQNYRYAPVVFLAPPWKEIYETDHERKQDYAEAERTYELMTVVYRDCGYDVCLLPRDTPAARADFIVNKLERDA